MKRITALITVIVMLFALAVPVWASENYVAVSVGKPITAAVDTNPSTAWKANDNNAISEFESAGSIESNSLTIDLEKKFILEYVIFEIFQQGSVQIEVSTVPDFSQKVVLEDGGLIDGYISKYVLPSENAGEAFRYVRMNFTRQDQYNPVLVFDFQVYTTEENSDGAGIDITVPEDFEENPIKISEGKPTTSKTDPYPEDKKAELATDNDENTFFQSVAGATSFEWVTIDLGAPVLFSYIESIFWTTRTSEMFVTNTSYDKGVEFEDGIKLDEEVLASPGNIGDGRRKTKKKFTLPDEYKNNRYRYVRLRFDNDTGTDTSLFPGSHSTTLQNSVVFDISVYQNTRDFIFNAAAQKNDALTDGDTATEVSVANNTVIDLLTPSYINSYTVYGADKGKVTLKGSLFNTTADNMTELPARATSDEKYRFVAIVTDDGTAVSLNEVEIWAYYSDVVTPWTKSGKNLSVTLTNTSHEDSRTYKLSATAFDSYGAVMGVKTVTETLTNGQTKTVAFDLDGADFAKKVVCTVERDGLLVSAPAVFVDGTLMTAPQGTPYTTAPQKELETAITKTDYNDGLQLAVAETNGVVNSDILVFNVYNESEELLAQDAAFGGATFKYRLPGNEAAGTYKAIVDATDAMGNSYKQTYTFTKTAPTASELTTAIDDFKNATNATEFETAFQTHYVTNGTLGFSDIPEAEALLTSGIGDSFVEMMSARTLWKKNPSETLTAEDIRDCMKAAVVQNALENKSADAPTVLSKYGSLLDNVFDGTQNNTYTAEIFKTGATTDEELIYNMKLAAALSKIKNASSESILQAMKDYTEILDVDFALINSNNVDELLVAKRIKDLIPETNIIPESFKDGLSAEIAQIVQDNAVVTPNPTPAPPSGGGGGGGGGGSYTGEKTDVVVKEDYKPSPSPVPAEKEPTKTVTFDDVADNHWAGSSIKKLAAAGIVSGRGDGSYDPDSQVSRAEFATMLVKAFGLISDPEEKPEFDDCKVSDWFYPYIDAAVSNNIVSGISKTEFAPAANISRQDACVMSYNIMIYKNYLKFFAGKTFTDSDKVPAYATDAVNMLSGSGVINGFTDGSFGPAELLSRAQAAIIVDKLMTLLGEEA